LVAMNLKKVLKMRKGETRLIVGSGKGIGPKNLSTKKKPKDGDKKEERGDLGKGKRCQNQLL